MPAYVPGKLTLASTYVQGDPNYSDVSLLLHGDGANGSTTIIATNTNILLVFLATTQEPRIRLVAGGFAALASNLSQNYGSSIKIIATIL